MESKQNNSRVDFLKRASLGALAFIGLRFFGSQAQERNDQALGISTIPDDEANELLRESRRGSIKGFKPKPPPAK